MVIPRRSPHLVALLVLGFFLPAAAEAPRTVKLHRKQCLEEGRVQGCRTWVEETALPLLCQPVSPVGFLELSPAVAVGAGWDGRPAVADPCTDLPEERSPGMDPKATFSALRRMASDPEQEEWATLVLAALELFHPREKSPSIAAAAEIEAWETHPFKERIATRLAPGMLLLSAQVRYRQAAWEDAAARALAFLDLFRWDGRAGIARLLLARSLALTGRAADALHHLGEVQRTGTALERWRSRLLAGLVRFHQVAGAGRRVPLVDRKGKYRPLPGLTKISDLAVAPDGSLAVAAREGIVVVDGRLQVPGKRIQAKNCMAVAFDSGGALFAACRAPGMIRLVSSPGESAPTWWVDRSWDPVPRTRNPRERDRWVRLYQDVDFLDVDVEGGTWLHLSGRDTAILVPPYRGAGGVRTFGAFVSSTQRPRAFCVLPGGTLLVAGNRARKGLMSFWTTTPGKPPRQATVVGPVSVREIIDAEADSLGWIWVLTRESFRKYRVLVVEPGAWKIRAQSGTLAGVDMWAIAPDEGGGAWVAAGGRQGGMALRHLVPGEL